MDLGLISLAIALLALTFSAIYEIKSYRIVQRMQIFLEHEAESRGSFGEQMEEWLLTTESDEEGAPTKLHAISSIVGRTMFQSLKMAQNQELSVNSRVQNKYDGMVETAIRKKQPLEMKILQKFLDYLDIDVDLLEIAKDGELGNLTQSLQKYGVNPNLAESGNVM